MKSLKWSNSLLAIPILLISTTFSSTALAQNESFCGKTYTIQSGDTLSLLANKAFDNTNDFLRFYEDSRNRKSLGTNPNRIKVGALLYLPPCSDGKTIELGESENTATVLTSDPFAGTIDIVTGTDFAPFTDEGLQSGGMLTAMVQEAFAQSDLDQEAKIVFINDWGSHLDTLLPDQKYEFAFPWYRPDCSDPNALSPKMRQRCDLVWSDPLFSVIIGFYSLATASNLPADFIELQGKHLCRPSGYFTFDLEENGLVPGTNIKLSQPGSVADCFELLEDGLVDFVTINRFTAEKAIATAGLDGLIVPISSIVTTQNLHLVGHQSSASAVRLISSFNAGLRRLSDSGRLSRITNFFMNEHQKAVEQLRTQ